MFKKTISILSIKSQKDSNLYYFKIVFEIIKMKNYKLKTSFVSTESLKARANKTGINFMNFISIFV